MDRVFAVHAFDSYRRTCPNDFPIQQTNIRIQCALSWKLVVSEWRSVIAVSLKVGGGVRLIKPAKLYICTQKHFEHNEDGCTAPGVRGHGSIPLSHTGNVVTRIIKTIPVLGLDSLPPHQFFSLVVGSSRPKVCKQSGSS